MGDFKHGFHKTVDVTRLKFNCSLALAEKIGACLITTRLFVMDDL